MVFFFDFDVDGPWNASYLKSMSALKKAAYQGSPAKVEEELDAWARFLVELREFECYLRPNTSLRFVAGRN